MSVHSERHMDIERGVTLASFESVYNVGVQMGLSTAIDIALKEIPSVVTDDASILGRQIGALSVANELRDILTRLRKGEKL